MKIHTLKKLVDKLKRKLFSRFKQGHVDKSIEPQFFQVKTQLLSKGRSDYTLARSEAMSVRIKCYAQDGENALHTHPGQDHTFVVLAGKARFYDVEGNTTELTRNHGILIPEGYYHHFTSCGDEALVMLRISAEKRKVPARRIGIDGKPFPGKTKENNYQEKVPIEGLYYE